MKISSRLLLALLPTVVGIMALYAVWAVREREAILLQESEADARVFSTAVSVAFAHAFRDLQYQDARELLAEIDEEPTLYGVVFYDLEGTPTIRSESIRLDDAVSPAAIRAALQGASPLVLDREVDGERVQSVLRVVHGRDGAATGVLEVAQPLAFLQGERVSTAGRFFLNTLTLLVVLGLLLGWLVRRHVGRPLGDFIRAIRGLGEGDLSRRLEERPRGSELAEAAREFNRMVDRLASAIDEVERETEERLALEQRMREREHLAALGTLSAGIAHQMGTPLSVIGGRAEVVLRRDRLAPEDARNLQIIREQSERITRIVRNLLQFARRPEPEIQPVEMVSIAGRALELLGPDLEEAGVRVERSFREPAWVEADPDLLEEVLLTLLENALHALREPGAETRMILRIEPSEGERMMIEIEDGGPGIEPGALPRIFEPFFTTRSGGTGLGLAVARGILEQLGGSLEVVNAPPRDGGSGLRSPSGAGGGAGGVVARIHLPRVRAAPGGAGIPREATRR